MEAAPYFTLPQQNFAGAACRGNGGVPVPLPHLGRMGGQHSIAGAGKWRATRDFAPATAIERGVRGEQRFARGAAVLADTTFGADGWAAHLLNLNKQGA